MLKSVTVFQSRLGPQTPAENTRFSLDFYFSALHLLTIKTMNYKKQGAVDWTVHSQRDEQGKKYIY